MKNKKQKIKENKLQVRIVLKIKNLNKEIYKKKIKRPKCNIFLIQIWKNRYEKKCSKRKIYEEEGSIKRQGC